MTFWRKQWEWDRMGGLKNNILYLSESTHNEWTDVFLLPNSILYPRVVFNCNEVGCTLIGL